MARLEDALDVLLGALVDAQGAAMEGAMEGTIQGGSAWLRILVVVICLPGQERLGIPNNAFCVPNKKPSGNLRTK
jgi:hypothetical protein